MCGRFALHKEKDALAEALELEQEQLEDYQPSFNIAPSQNCLILREDSGIKADSFNWGLIPSWDTESSKRLINARVETMQTKASFRHLICHKRVIIPMDGYYEWLPGKVKKQPYFISAVNQSILLAAGLYDQFTDKNGNEHFHFTIITTEAADNIKSIHPRMPLTLSLNEAKIWLSTQTEEHAAIETLIKSKIELHSRMVDPWVNKIENNSLRCLQDPPPPKQLELF